MIGRYLIPHFTRTRAAVVIAVVAAGASVLLNAMPIEMWVMPSVLLVPHTCRRLCLASELGVWLALISLFALGRWVGDLGVTPFLLETSGLRQIAAFQNAHELLGAMQPIAIGIVGPAARDAALMAGQRVNSEWQFALFSAAHVVIRGALFTAVFHALKGLPKIDDFCIRFTFVWWTGLVILSVLLN